MRVLVTGGAGYVGYSLVGALLAEPSVDEIVVFDNLSRRQYALLWGRRSDGRVRFVEADILDGRTLAKAVEGVDAVVHLAASVHLPGQDSEAHSFDQVNNWGSAQVAAAIEDNASIAHAIYLSSVTVYGSSDDEMTVDTTPEPNTFYGITKLRGEGHFRRLESESRRVHVIRAGNVYGFNPAARFDTVINRFLLDARFARRMRIVGSGDQTRSFVTVHRLAEALCALLCSTLNSATLNVVDDTTSILEVAELIQSFRPDVELLFVDQDIRMQRMNVRTSNEVLGLIGAPSMDIVESLRAEWEQLGI